MSKKPRKVRDLLIEETGGESYKAHKYSLDVSERSNFDYETENIQWKKIAETTNHKEKYVKLNSACENIIKNYEPILTYFLDGSRRVFKVDDVAYYNGNRSVIYPIIAGQIGVGCCCRKDKKKIIIEKFNREIVLVVPDVADADGKTGFFPALTKKLNECEDLKRLRVSFSNVLSYTTSRNDNSKFEDRATARVQDKMIEREKELVAELVKENKLGQDNYLIKDGSLEYRPAPDLKKDFRKYQTFKHNYNWVLGVSKSFNSEVCLDLNGKSAPGYIAKLPNRHRTPVACYDNPDYLGDIQFAVWYIRLREQNQTRSPFDGIIKVEKILVSDDEIDNGMNSDTVDMLSAHLINERNPVCYGSDIRWANHLYPIYMTEMFVKSRYISAESFLHLF
ncbi:MAG: hypothetical protein LBP59_13455 [Planctomycetaceae bacterium]|jgi:hypothetical protein|nr:hypothetical protein [Planctomycetaceae bacterium]